MSEMKKTKRKDVKIRLQENEVHVCMWRRLREADTLNVEEVCCFQPFSPWTPKLF